MCLPQFIESCTVHIIVGIVFCDKRDISVCVYRHGSLSSIVSETFFKHQTIYAVARFIQIFKAEGCTVKVKFSQTPP